MTAEPTCQTGVYSTTVQGHTHWSYRCPCGYDSPFFTPTTKAAAKSYATHLVTCQKPVSGGLPASLVEGLHGLKHGGFVPFSMLKGLAHFGYASTTAAENTYAITEQGLTFLTEHGVCEPKVVGR